MSTDTAILADSDEESDWPHEPPIARVEYGDARNSNCVVVESSPDYGGERRMFTVASYACQSHADEHARRINEALAWNWKTQ